MVLGERNRKVIQFSDENNNARMIENPVIEGFDSEKTATEIVDVRTWISKAGTPEESQGTEVEVLLTPIVEAEESGRLKGDPLPGDPEGEVFVEFTLITTSAATQGAIVSSIIEAVPTV